MLYVSSSICNDPELVVLMRGHNPRCWSNIKSTDAHYCVINQRSKVGLMLVHRLRRWPNIKPTLAQRLENLPFTCYIMLCTFSPTCLYPLEMPRTPYRASGGKRSQ